MIRSRILTGSAVASAMALALACPAQAQTAPTEIVAPPTPNADRLADELRVLAENPRDVRALLSAGDLSAKLDDPAAALAFYERAEEIEPDNPRILSGRGRAIVRMQRPGEALLLFNQAEAKGVPVESFAADRGLAYDLLGAPQLAQADYRRALKVDPDDRETARRLALSLGIGGDLPGAIAILDPMIRENDRASWRARAFVLAMNGDVAGAEEIAEGMLPGNMGLSMTPFFRRLAALSPSERAFAVHFGEITPSAERLADARLAPALPRLSAPPVALASTTPAPAGRRGRRSRGESRTESLLPQGRTPDPAPQPVRTASRPAEPAPVPKGAPDPGPVTVTLASATTPPTIGSEDARIASLVGAESPPAPGPLPPAKAAPAPKAEPAARQAPVVKPEPAVKPAPKPKPAPAKPDPKKAEPARYWVQLGIGQDEKALPATFKKLVAKAPVGLKGKSAWMTPLNRTNRLLTGPFDNAADAQAFVNALKKEGVDSYTFQSEAGQKITRLPTK